jgi:hypothetical protein
MAYEQVTLTSRPDRRWVTTCHPSEAMPVNAPMTPVIAPMIASVPRPLFLLLSRPSTCRTTVLVTSRRVRGRSDTAWRSDDRLIGTRDIRQHWSLSAETEAGNP